MQVVCVFVYVCMCVCEGSTQDWVCFGGGGRQLPTPPGAADDESTYESCSSCSLSPFSEEFSGNLRDPGSVCVCAFVFRERVTVELGSAVLYQFRGGIFKLLRSCHECCSSNPCHVLMQNQKGEICPQCR